MKDNSKSVAITPGSELGVGPELLVKALAEITCERPQQFFWCSDRSSLELGASRAKCLIDFVNNSQARINGHLITFFNSMSHESSNSKRQALALKKSVELALDHQVGAIVTGPVEKSALAFFADQSLVGQTEYFAKYLKKPGHKPFMAFMGGPFILSLLSTHVPLKQVSANIDQDKILSHLKTTALECAAILKKSPSQLKISLLGLNPHAGEDGLLGDEEILSLIPAIKAARSIGLNISGPLPADGFFSYFHLLKPELIPDVLIATYHDQGLIPYKLLTKGHSVNITLGLSIPRVSPSHGTAPELVGLNIACTSSTKLAITTAIELANA